MRKKLQWDYKESSDSSDFTGGEHDSDYNFEADVISGVISSSSVEFVDIQRKSQQKPTCEATEALDIITPLHIRTGYKIKYNDAPMTFNIFSPNNDLCFTASHTDIKWYDKNDQMIRFLNENTNK